MRRTNKHFIKMTDFHEIIEKEKTSLSVIENAGYSMRKAAEKIIIAAGMSDKNFELVPDTIEDLFDIFDDLFYNDIPPIQPMPGLTFKYSVNNDLDEEYNAVVYVMSSDEDPYSLFFSPEIIHSSKEKVEIFDTESLTWEDCSSEEFARRIIEFKNLSEGEKEFYSFCAMEINPDHETAKLLLKKTGRLPALYESLIGNGIDAFVVRAEINEGNEALGVLVPDSGYVILQSAINSNFEMFTYDTEHSDDYLVTGLVKISECNSPDGIISKIAVPMFN